VTTPASGLPALRAPFPYEGPDALRDPGVEALSQVMDPEIALCIVDVGLVRGVTLTPARWQVRMALTSAACPMGGLVVDDVVSALSPLAPPGVPIDVELEWDPPWTPDSMSDHARRFMGW
jgi:metal-sulfur cluster biosynthetic enzyme